MSRCVTNRSLRFVVPLLLLAASVACVSTSPQSARPEGVASEEPESTGRAMEYLQRRLLDFIDIASLRMGIGPGLLLHARATRFLAIGAGEIGPQQPWRSGFRVEVHWVGTSRREGGVWTERRAELGFSTIYYSESEGRVLRGGVDRFGSELRDDYDCGLEAYLALIGVAFDFRPIEFADFFAGWFGFDPSGDDVTEYDAVDPRTP